MKFEPKIHILGNLRVVLVKEDRESVTVRAMIGTGSREETDKEAGSAHFLEHFVFKGTDKYPGMHDISEVIEKVGGTTNAYTSQNEMGFWVKMSKENIDLATQLLGQIITAPILPKDHFDKERGTILEELYMYEDMPSSKAGENLLDTMYGESNLGRPIIGTVESLKNMTVEDLRKYYEKWFVAKNIIIGVVGDYGSEEKILNLIKQEFKTLIEDTREIPTKDVFQWDLQDQPRIAVSHRKLDQAAVYLGFRGLPVKHKLNYALELANLILGMGFMSRLFKEVREERGWAYHIGSGANQYEDVGDVLIEAGLPKNKLNEAIGLITEICYGIGGSNKWKITKEELETAKNTYKGRLALAYDKPETVLGNALDNLMFQGKIKSPKRICEKIDEVTLEEVQEVCNLIFKPENLSISVLGDYQKEDLKI